MEESLWISDTKKTNYQTLEKDEKTDVCVIGGRIYKRNDGEIYSLYIINGYKGYGYGKKLMKVGINELREIGCNKMLIGCLQGNPSNEFYKHIGGKFIKTRFFQKLDLIENVYFFENIININL